MAEVEIHINDPEVTARLSNTVELAPYVIGVVEGSIASLENDLAIPYTQSGDDPLIRSNLTANDASTSLTRLIARGEVVRTGVEVHMSNSKRDESIVTLSDAVHFFNTFEREGVMINKVSTSGNSRGFYKVEALKRIAAGLGIRMVKGAGKGAYVEAIRLFHSRNTRLIEEDRERDRLDVNLGEELGLEPSE